MHHIYASVSIGSDQPHGFALGESEREFFVAVVKNIIECRIAVVIHTVSVKHGYIDIGFSHFSVLKQINRRPLRWSVSRLSYVWHSCHVVYTAALRNKLGQWVVGEEISRIDIVLRCIPAVGIVLYSCYTLAATQIENSVCIDNLACAYIYVVCRYLIFIFEIAFRIFCVYDYPVVYPVVYCHKAALVDKETRCRNGFSVCVCGRY